MQKALWKAMMAEHEKLLESGLQMSMRGAGYWNSDQTAGMMVAEFYQGNSPVKLVYHIEAWHNSRGITTKIDGPFEDSGDAYWNEMYERDQKENDYIVIETRDGQRQHYTVKPDSKEPGWGDGFGGGLFRFEISREFAKVLSDKGLKVVFTDEKWILESRNVWSQDLIPRKHWDKFPINAKHLPPRPAAKIDS